MGSLRSILVVDDDPDMRDLLSRILIKAGYQLQDEADGELALATLELRRFDLVVTDLVMPHREGLDILMTIRSRWPSTKVVVVSGASHIGGTDFLEVAVRLGADAALPKPVTADVLLATVADLLRDTV